MSSINHAMVTRRTRGRGSWARVQASWVRCPGASASGCPTCAWASARPSAWASGHLVVGSDQDVQRFMEVKQRQQGIVRGTWSAASGHGMHVRVPMCKSSA